MHLHGYLGRVWESISRETDHDAGLRLPNQSYTPLKDLPSSDQRLKPSLPYTRAMLLPKYHHPMVTEIVPENWIDIVYVSTEDLAPLDCSSWYCILPPTLLTSNACDQTPDPSTLSPLYGRTSVFNSHT